MDLEKGQGRAKGKLERETQKEGLPTSPRQQGKTSQMVFFEQFPKQMNKNTTSTDPMTSLPCFLVCVFTYVIRCGFSFQCWLGVLSPLPTERVSMTNLAWFARDLPGFSTESPRSRKPLSPVSQERRVIYCMLTMDYSSRLSSFGSRVVFRGDLLTTLHMFSLVLTYPERHKHK